MRALFVFVLTIIAGVDLFSLKFSSKNLSNDQQRSLFNFMDNAINSDDGINACIKSRGQLASSRCLRFIAKSLAEAISVLNLPLQTQFIVNSGVDDELTISTTMAPLTPTSTTMAPLTPTCTTSVPIYFDPSTEKSLSLEMDGSMFTLKAIRNDSEVVETTTQPPPPPQITNIMSNFINTFSEIAETLKTLTGKLRFNLSPEAQFIFNAGSKRPSKADYHISSSGLICKPPKKTDTTEPETNEECSETTVIKSDPEGIETTESQETTHSDSTDLDLETKFLFGKPAAEKAGYHIVSGGFPCKHINKTSKTEQGKYRESLQTSVLENDPEGIETTESQETTTDDSTQESTELTDTTGGSTDLEEDAPETEHQE